MKKSMFASVKPLAMATAIAAGTSISMIAVALPGGGDTLGAAGVVNESVCFNTVDMTIASGSRSVTTGTGDCQLRTLVPTKGFQAFDTTPAGATVVDSSALKNAGGESYETYVGGNRKGSLLLTPNRSLAVTRSSSFATGADGSVSFDLGAAVQPATGLQSSWMTGTYNIINRSHVFQSAATDLENSPYAAPNPALSEINSTAAMSVTFNGDGTCSIDAMDNHRNAQLTKDPLINYIGEMDNGCTVGGGNCGQNDGNNYLAKGVINLGASGSQVGYYDWNDATLDGSGGQAVACNYTVGSGVVTVAYETESFADAVDPTAVNWTVSYNVSADLRYLVAAQAGTLGQTGGSVGPDNVDLSVGVRVGAGDVTGKTYLFNQTAATYAASTPTTASYENPQTPNYQEQECLTRGAIEFTSTSMGGGFNACNVQSVSSCAARNNGGDEESTDGAADGTITDTLTAADGVDTAITACRWSNASGLVVEMDTTDYDLNPITLNYTGDVSDNGEALVMQGEYSVEGPAPDVENAPALPQQKYSMVNYMLAQEYQGSLTADADVDGASNYDEFVWAADVTPAGGAVENDYNNDATADVLLRSSTGWRMFLMANGAANTNNGPALYATGYDLVASEDFDADGDTDVLLRNPTTGAWRMFIMQNGAVASNSAFGAYAATTWSFAAAADFNGDGTKDILLKSSTGWRVFNVVNGATTTNTNYAAYATGWDLAAAVDTDKDGDADLVLKKTGGGGWRIFTTQNSVTTANAALALYATNWDLVSSEDFDGDGDVDFIGRSTVDGSWRTFVMENNAVASNASPGFYASAAWTLDFASDMDSDGDKDVVMRSNTGGWRLFTMAGGVSTSNANLALYASTAWVTADVKDFNGDGTSDVMLRNTSTNDWRSFNIINGAVTANQATGLYVSAAWTLQK